MVFLDFVVLSFLLRIMSLAKEIATISGAGLPDRRATAGRLIRRPDGIARFSFFAASRSIFHIKSGIPRHWVSLA